MQTVSKSHSISHEKGNNSYTFPGINNFCPTIKSDSDVMWTNLVKSNIDSKWGVHGYNNQTESNIQTRTITDMCPSNS